MTTLKQHAAMRIMMDSESYCPSCGESKVESEDYCLDCYMQGEEVVLSGGGMGWEPIHNVYVPRGTYVEIIPQ